NCGGCKPIWKLQGYESKEESLLDTDGSLLQLLNEVEDTVFSPEECQAEKWSEWEKKIFEKRNQMKPICIKCGCKAFEDYRLETRREVGKDTIIEHKRCFGKCTSCKQENEFAKGKVMILNLGTE